MKALGRAVRARDGRAGVLGLRFPRAVGVRRGGDLLAGHPGGSLRRHDARRGRRRAARVTSSSWATGSPGLGHVGHRRGSEDDARRRCPGGRGRSSCGPCRPTRCWASGGRAWGSGRPSPRPAPAAGALRTECGNTVYPPSYDGARQWGGYPNGLIPPSAHVPARAWAATCSAATPRGLQGDLGGPRGDVRRPGVRHRLLPRYAARSGSTGTTAPWPRSRAPPTTAGGGGRPVRRGRDLRHRAVRLDEGQRPALRLDAPRLGGGRATPEEPWHWEYGGLLTRRRRNCRWSLLPCGQLTEESRRAHRLRHLHRPGRAATTASSPCCWAPHRAGGGVTHRSCRSPAGRRRPDGPAPERPAAGRPLRAASTAAGDRAVIREGARARRGRPPGRRRRRVDVDLALTPPGPVTRGRSSNWTRSSVERSRPWQTSDWFRPLQVTFWSARRQTTAYDRRMELGHLWPTGSSLSQCITALGSLAVRPSGRPPEGDLGRTPPNRRGPLTVPEANRGPTAVLG